MIDELNKIIGKCPLGFGVKLGYGSGRVAYVRSDHYKPFTYCIVDNGVIEDWKITQPKSFISASFLDYEEGLDLIMVVDNHTEIIDIK